MTPLTQDIRYIKGIGEARAKLLGKLGVSTLEDLISYFPRDYEDRTAVRPVAELADGEAACVLATVVSPVRRARIRKGLDLTKTRVADASGAMDLTFFNQNYVKDSLLPGETYYFFGRAEVRNSHRSMANPVFEREGAPRFSTGRIVPVYRLTAGLSSLIIARAVDRGLEACGDILPDPLPDALRERHGLAHARFAYETIHFPPSFEALKTARHRLIFEEFFILSLGLGLLRGRRGREDGLRLHPADPGDFFRRLPFSPTGAQKRAVDDAVSDMLSGVPMNRLIQGDVGSGKTVCAAACAWFAAQSGYQSALMVPTEILAEQHCRTLTPLMAQCGLRTGLLTGALTAKERREVLYKLASGETDLIVGTHALISEGVEYAKLGLVITDEQHRFGVTQRAAIAAKGNRPHVLVMSATPIPRTLALILYGELDVSVIDELPPGRQRVDTFAVGEEMRPRIHKFIRRLVSEGRQVFIVCPLVEEGDAPPDDRRAVTEYAEGLQREIFPELRVSYIHGRMKDKEKDRIMAAFAAGESDILVSTTVIEVGVDVPNAALMIVENAERFGLSQLHQLRGRVGRGEHKSYCILFSSSKSAETRERLNVMQKTSDGFVIAEEDLRLRGPGDFFGSRQHGLPEMKIADFATDMETLREAQREAGALLREDADLSLPVHLPLREKIARLFDPASGAFN
ncbi:ATP-dependent DNA helicase RecG [Papillibacter cinnamivorans]|uniref:ATP-dependent DNA helicase RecG n=1 Tax=Papillibacter cinnamivorans DSM 12816 TaxID=1122930 RepID=A0A1W2BGF2_9FIRM|nr:ATP-dependent DNA helicase RecG [Papillibacter cinnamivorans]SMC72009.1 ATP-dependent DNA helicase RecG [Papillibacter cinnamivorans DSM 12816]